MAPFDETEGVFQAGFGGQELSDPRAAPGPWCSFTAQAESSWDFFTRSTFESCEGELLGKSPLCSLCNPCTCRGKLLAQLCLDKTMQFPLHQHGASSCSSIPVSCGELWRTPAHPSCMATSPTQLLTRGFPFGTPHRPGFQPTAPGVSPA